MITNKYIRATLIICVIALLMLLTYKAVYNFGNLKVLALSWYAWLNAQNQMIAGAISLWALGSLTYIFKSIPQKIWVVLLKQFTLSLILNNEDNVYRNFLVWYHKSGKSRNSRTLLANNYWDDETEMEQLNISAGYGTHYFVFKNKIFKFSRDLKETNNTRSVKESLTLTTIGRSQEQFHELLELITPEKQKNNVTSIYQWHTSESYWKPYSEQPVRKFDSVILPKSTKESIIDHLNTFLNNRDWYLDVGIPYRTGVILYGIPGTGKTSLARALCEKFNKPLYTLSLSNVTDSSLEAALSSIPRNSILLLEDIDTYSITTKREEKSEDSILNGSAFNALTLSGLLNAIDGIISSDGRILIATTNHVEKLDPALTRKGRFNMSVEIGYLTDECFKEFFSRFFPDFILQEGLKFKKDMPPSDLQALIIDNLDSPETVLSFCLEDSTKC